MPENAQFRSEMANFDLKNGDFDRKVANFDSKNGNFRQEIGYLRLGRGKSIPIWQSDWHGGTGMS